MVNEVDITGGTGNSFVAKSNKQGMRAFSLWKLIRQEHSFGDQSAYSQEICQFDKGALPQIKI